MKVKILLILSMSTMVFFSCKKISQGKNQQITAIDSTGFIVKVGDTAPDFVTYLTTGEQIQLSSLRDEVVMLQFTASWCSVCREEMPAIESEIWQKYQSNPDFSLLAIDLKEPIEKIVPFIADTKITYPVVFDPEGKIFGLYAQSDAGVTRNVIIGKDGRIAMLTRLYDKNEFKKMVQCIDSLIRIDIYNQP